MCATRCGSRIAYLVLAARTREGRTGVGMRDNTVRRVDRPLRALPCLTYKQLTEFCVARRPFRDEPGDWDKWKLRVRESPEGKDSIRPGVLESCAVAGGRLQIWSEAFSNNNNNNKRPGRPGGAECN